MSKVFIFDSRKRHFNLIKRNLGNKSLASMEYYDFSADGVANDEDSRRNFFAQTIRNAGDEALLVLVHCGDVSQASLCDYVEYWAEKCRSLVLVIFSGGGVKRHPVGQGRCSPGGRVIHFHIKRSWDEIAWNDISGIVSSFLEFIGGGNKQPITDAIKRLEENSEYQNLMALCLLCQGYLAVHACSLKNSGAISSDNVRLALDRMGWDEVMSERFEDIGEEIVTVQDPDWWLGVFTGLDEMKIALESELKEVSQPKMVSVKELIKLLSERKRLSDSIVSKAFLDLHEMLSGV